MNNYVGQRLGNYRLIYLLGSGNFSDVYFGEDSRTGAGVAVKVLGMRLTSQYEVERFVNEIRVISLQHPNIVKVLDLGIEKGIPFLVLEYASNGTLRQRYPRGAILPLDTVVHYIEQIAAALQYAHDRQLMHLDIKPDNFLLDRDERILLSDFGMATAVQSTNIQNRQQIAGTVPYMAPEQLEGKPSPQSDQYALGIIAYEWLTGELPFQGTLQQITVQHQLRPVPSLHQKNPAVSLQVERVIMKALAKNPSERFDRVQLFADALKEAWQQQTNELYTVTQQQIGNVPPLPRRKVIAGTIAILTVGSIGGIGWAFARGLVHISFGSAAPTPPPVTSTPVPVNPSTLCTYKGHAIVGTVFGLTWAPDGTRIASGGVDRTVQVWDPINCSAQTLLTYQGHQKTVTAVAWSPNGKYMASTSDDSTVQVWDLQGNLIWNFTGHIGDVHSVVWSRDGTLIASGGIDRTVHVWDGVNGSPEPVFVYRGHTNSVWDVAWSPDGRYLASGCSDHTVHVWQALTGNLMQTYQKHTDELRGVAWASNGTLIASCGLDGKAHVWDAFSGKTVLIYKEHSDVMDHVSWSSDSASVASGSGDTTVRVWEPFTGRTIAIYRGHKERVRNVEWAPYSRDIASASYDGTVQVWKAP
jgi:eukaryotic-like serine/threonine-protein kinase